MKKYPYIEKAMDYIDGVLDGSIPACKWIRLACQRQIDDLKRAQAKKSKWEFVFDPVKAEKICKFVELMPHIKGEWAGSKIKLEPWQCFYFTTKYGWVRKKTGHRRFRTSYAEIPRKNAKSTVSSAEMLFMATADGEPGAECYSAATTNKQARIVFDVANMMAKKCPEFLDYYNIRARAHDIIVDSNDSKCEPVSAEAKNLDGLNIHFASVDELHAHKTRAVYDVIETACGARTQSMLSVITTAGDDIRGICYELHTYLKKVLEGIFNDDSFFGLIYTIDDDDDWYSEEAFVKANPNFGISVKPEMLRSLGQKALRSSSSQNNFKTKHLNIWAKSNNAWMNMEKWRMCADLMRPRPKLQDLKGHKCYVGFDASTKLDVSALVMLFEIDNIWLPYSKFYLPSDTVAERASSTYSHYEGWAKDGLFTLTPGDIVDYSYIEDDIREINSMFDVDSIAYDPWQTTHMAQRLINDGVNMVEMAANVKNFSEPMKHLEALVHSQKIDHGHCPILTWMISNVVAHYDKKDNIYPNKERKEDKIDGVIALIQALGRVILHDDHFVSVYESRGILGA